MHLYTRILTGMVLLLNIGLLIAIRMAVKYAGRACSLDQSEQGPRYWKSARRSLAILILCVVCMNAAAVYANHRMVNATRDVAAELHQQTGTEIALSAPR